uniref:Uncharacterized protein n=1 Tax=Rhizophora mucronata TaxID=61149 RepID=A0A2P2N8K2_RHIMU
MTDKHTFEHNLDKNEIKRNAKNCGTLIHIKRG